MIPDYFSKEQKQAVEQFFNFFNISNAGFVYQIDGAAGTGKTELTTYILSQIKNTVICASTNKACQVLFARLNGIGCEIITCHTFLKGVLKYNKNGKQTWHFNLNSITIPDLIIIDEVSMVDRIIFDQFKFLVERKNAKILTLGDRCQLPPVEEELTSFYEYFNVQSSLKKNMRNSGHTYNVLLSKIRKIILGEKINTLNQSSIAYWLAKYTPTYTLQTYSDIDDIPHEIFEQFRNNKDAIFLAHRTNKKCNTVNLLNLKIRKVLYENSEKKFIIGDKIIFTDFLQVDDKYFHTNDLDTITNIKEDTGIFYDDKFKIYILTLSDKTKICTVHEMDYERFNKKLTMVKQNILESTELLENICSRACINSNNCSHTSEIDELWKNFHTSYKNIYAPIDYAYALSVHKSQGSTYKQTFLYLSDFIWMLGKKETIIQFFKLLYVGLSRTQSHTIIF